MTIGDPIDPSALSCETKGVSLACGDRAVIPPTARMHVAGAFPDVPFLWYFPYIDFPIRVITWVIAALFLSGLVFVTKFPPVRVAIVLLYLAIFLFITWPASRPIDGQALSREYTDALRSYTGCLYIWGGESASGIDCSGFVRKAMEDALFKRACKGGNPAALRASISLYWHDTNARVIGAGYDGRTLPITICTNLNVLDYSKLRAGDLAVTTGGDHIMAYLGNKTWIAADPNVGHVTEFHIPESANPYFSTGMRIVRWKWLYWLDD